MGGGPQESTQQSTGGPLSAQHECGMCSLPHVQVMAACQQWQRLPARLTDADSVQRARPARLARRLPPAQDLGTPRAWLPSIALVPLAARSAAQIGRACRTHSAVHWREPSPWRRPQLQARRRPPAGLAGPGDLRSGRGSASSEVARAEGGRGGRRRPPTTTAGGADAGSLHDGSPRPAGRLPHHPPSQHNRRHRWPHRGPSPAGRRRRCGDLREAEPSRDAGGCVARAASRLPVEPPGSGLVAAGVT